jgi:hypothetical protein
VYYELNKFYTDPSYADTRNLMSLIQIDGSASTPYSTKNNGNTIVNATVSSSNPDVGFVGSRVVDTNNVNKIDPTKELARLGLSYGVYGNTSVGLNNLETLSTIRYNKAIRNDKFNIFTGKFNKYYPLIASDYLKQDKCNDYSASFNAGIPFNRPSSNLELNEFVSNYSMHVESGNNVSISFDSFDITFDHILSEGIISKLSLVESSYGYFYEIASSASYSGNITMCFNVPETIDFNDAKIYHFNTNNNPSGVFENITITSGIYGPDESNRKLCGVTSSLSPIILVPAPTIVHKPDIEKLPNDLHLTISGGNGAITTLNPDGTVKDITWPVPPPCPPGQTRYFSISEGYGDCGCYKDPLDPEVLAERAKAIAQILTVILILYIAKEKGSSAIGAVLGRQAANQASLATARAAYQRTLAELGRSTPMWRSRAAQAVADAKDYVDALTHAGELIHLELLSLQATASALFAAIAELLRQLKELQMVQAFSGIKTCDPGYILNNVTCECDRIIPCDTYENCQCSDIEGYSDIPLPYPGANRQCCPPNTTYSDEYGVCLSADGNTIGIVANLGEIVRCCNGSCIPAIDACPPE